MGKEDTNDRGKKKKNQEDDEHGPIKDMKDFMDDIEEDPEMRKEIELYKVNSIFCLNPNLMIE